MGDEWSNHRKIVSVVLSFAAAVLLIRQFWVPGTVDGWTIVLLVVLFLPWMSPVFESIEFPGGGSVKYRELKKTQDYQGSEIRTLQFLTANFLTDVEKIHLRKLASGYRFELRPEMPGPFYDEVRRLRSLGFITQRGMPGVQSMRGQFGDVKDFFEISPRGTEYLTLLNADQIEKGAEETNAQ